MRVAVDLFEKLWAAIEDQNKNCEACLKHSRIRARRGLRNPVS
jgi:hypothetical protein